MRFCRSEQIRELFFGEASLPNESAESAFGKLAVIGDGQAAARRMAEDDVAAGLVVHFVAEFSKGFDRV